MRAIAEEASALVREYKGAHSGEHGDGLVRSEWIEPMFGPRIDARLRGDQGRASTRDGPDEPRQDRAPAEDGRPRAVPLSSRAIRAEARSTGARLVGLSRRRRRLRSGAVEMCNNNGHCRKFDAGTMCPTFRATRDEQHLTRGRANTLRLALSGPARRRRARLGRRWRRRMDLCVGCKGCKRECPTGVDMAKHEDRVPAARRQRHGLSLQDRLVAYLPRYAPLAARLPWLLNLRDRLPGAGRLRANRCWACRRAALAAALAARSSSDVRRRSAGPARAGREVVLFVDTFNSYFEPRESRAPRCGARGRRAIACTSRRPTDGRRPLCCGRTFLAAGLVDEAQAEARRTLAALRPFVDARRARSSGSSRRAC